ncbi:hypothetical protein ACEWY4_020698 [Coilia grayii]|uniref:LRRNT domain-containing protein n=1 Tax=Coilia grayii TaxID=363190 RepID=A0ABD1J6V7_9TELE
MPGRGVCGGAVAGAEAGGLAVRAGLWCLLLWGALLGGAADACPALCTCSGTTVDCHGLGLKTVPRNIPRNTERLNPPTRLTPAFLLASASPAEPKQTAVWAAALRAQQIRGPKSQGVCYTSLCSTGSLADSQHLTLGERRRLFIFIISLFFPVLKYHSRYSVKGDGQEAVQEEGERKAERRAHTPRGVLQVLGPETRAIDQAAEVALNAPVTARNLRLLRRPSPRLRRPADTSRWVVAWLIGVVGVVGAVGVWGREVERSSHTVLPPAYLTHHETPRTAALLILRIPDAALNATHGSCAYPTRTRPGIKRHVRRPYTYPTRDQMLCTAALCILRVPNPASNATHGSCAYPCAVSDRSLGQR